MKWVRSDFMVPTTSSSNVDLPLLSSPESLSESGGRARFPGFKHYRSLKIILRDWWQPCVNVVVSPDLPETIVSPDSPETIVSPDTPETIVSLLL